MIFDAAGAQDVGLRRLGTVTNDDSRTDQPKTQRRIMSMTRHFHPFPACTFTTAALRLGLPARSGRFIVFDLLQRT